MSSRHDGDPPLSPMNVARTPRRFTFQTVYKSATNASTAPGLATLASVALSGAVAQGAAPATGPPLGAVTHALQGIAPAAIPTAGAALAHAVGATVPSTTPAAGAGAGSAQEPALTATLSADAEVAPSQDAAPVAIAAAGVGAVAVQDAASTSSHASGATVEATQRHAAPGEIAATGGIGAVGKSEGGQDTSQSGGVRSSRLKLQTLETLSQPPTSEETPVSTFVPAQEVDSPNALAVRGNKRPPASVPVHFSSTVQPVVNSLAPTAYGLPTANAVASQNGGQAYGAPDGSNLSLPRYSAISPFHASMQLLLTAAYMLPDATGSESFSQDAVEVAHLPHGTNIRSTMRISGTPAGTKSVASKKRVASKKKHVRKKRRVRKKNNHMKYGNLYDDSVKDLGDDQDDSVKDLDDDQDDSVRDLGDDQASEAGGGGGGRSKSAAGGGSGGCAKSAAGRGGGGRSKSPVAAEEKKTVATSKRKYTRRTVLDRKNNAWNADEQKAFDLFFFPVMTVEGWNEDTMAMSRATGRTRQQVRSHKFKKFKNWLEDPLMKNYVPTTGTAPPNPLVSIYTIKPEWAPEPEPGAEEPHVLSLEEFQAKLLDYMADGRVKWDGVRGIPAREPEILQELAQEALTFGPHVFDVSAGTGAQCIRPGFETAFDTMQAFFVEIADRLHELVDEGIISEERAIEEFCMDMHQGGVHGSNGGGGSSSSGGGGVGGAELGNSSGCGTASGGANSSGVEAA